MPHTVGLILSDIDYQKYKSEAAIRQEPLSTYLRELLRIAPMPLGRPPLSAVPESDPSGRHGDFLDGVYLPIRTTAADARGNLRYHDTGELVDPTLATHTAEPMNDGTLAWYDTMKPMTKKEVKARIKVLLCSEWTPEEVRELKLLRGK